MGTLNANMGTINADMEKYIRAYRIIEFGKWLSTVNINETKFIINKNGDSANKNNVYIFEPGCIQPDPTDQLLEEMKSINITDGDINNALRNKGTRLSFDQIYILFLIKFTSYWKFFLQKNVEVF